VARSLTAGRLRSPELLDREALPTRSPALRAYIERTRAALSAAQTPSEAAALIIEALTVERPVFRMQTSDRAREFVGVKLADLDVSSVVGMTKTWVA
jgi:hypothetical protein